jgi:hypothetical protein
MKATRKRRPPTRRVPVTISFAAQVLDLSHPGARHALAEAGIAPKVIALSASGRLVKLFDKAAVLKLALGRTYNPPPRARVAPKEK